ncbi:unnamed protein product [Cylicocyclus nassatus]|uniref:Peptidase S1 domain-containing protein n=1 Tax=Cylicocyclus nassatus TaxID=53992 RepID=A0AA36GWZ8_CYLNA|nr:unnamed protein product [Cylicocyclus nassatus]
MTIFLCLLINIHLMMGYWSNAGSLYDARTCGKKQMHYAYGHIGGNSYRHRRSANLYGQNINTSTNKDYEEEYKLEEGQPEEDDFNDPMQEKVMGGERARRGELPWAVLLSFGYPNGLCGGTLISRRHVITAAHCFWPRDAECSTSKMYTLDYVRRNLQVFINGTCVMAGVEGCTISDVSSMYKVARAYYKGFFERGCKYTHDIAILELTKDVPATDPYVRLRAFGWGLDPIKFPESIPPYLQKLYLGSKMSQKKCKQVLEDFNSESDDTFCTAEGQERNVCHGDSGGGVYATINGRDYLIGIVSFGSDCEELLNRTATAAAQMNTDIVYHKDLIMSWIQPYRTQFY